jgi:hypothetical protein
MWFEALLWTEKMLRTAQQPSESRERQLKRRVFGIGSSKCLHGSLGHLHFGVADHFGFMFNPEAVSFLRLAPSAPGV